MENTKLNELVQQRENLQHNLGELEAQIQKLEQQNAKDIESYLETLKGKHISIETYKSDDYEEWSYLNITEVQIEKFRQYDEAITIKIYSSYIVSMDSGLNSPKVKYDDALCLDIYSETTLQQIKDKVSIFKTKAQAQTEIIDFMEDKIKEWF